MANETQAMQMLSTYNNKDNPGRVNYILVFTVLQISQQSSGSYVAIPSGYGDEGKWVWMARISGDAKNRLINEGFMNPSTAWTDEKTFGETKQPNRKMAMERSRIKQYSTGTNEFRRSIILQPLDQRRHQS